MGNRRKGTNGKVDFEERLKDLVRITEGSRVEKDIVSRLLTIPEVAERLNVPVSWVYERTRHNAIPGQIRLGRYVRIRESDLEDFINNGVYTE